MKTKYRTFSRFDFLPYRSRELSQRQHMHKLCAQIKKRKHSSRLVTSSPRAAQLLLGTLTGMFKQTHTHTHPPTHFKTIKQTFFFVLTPLDLQKAQLLFKSRRCMNSEKRKTSTKITFKTLQPHNAAGQRGGGSWLATYNKRLHIL